MNIQRRCHTQLSLINPVKQTAWADSLRADSSVADSFSCSIKTTDPSQKPKRSLETAWKGLHSLFNIFERKGWPSSVMKKYMKDSKINGLFTMDRYTIGTTLVDENSHRRPRIAEFLIMAMDENWLNESILQFVLVLTVLKFLKSDNY